MNKHVGLFIIALLLAACTTQPSQMGTAWGSGAFASNGERIYFTATNEQGERITYTGGPDVGYMMTGGVLTCASCHGPSGRGGLHVMHMEVMDAPDIRWSALTSEAHEGQEAGGHAGDYDLETFRMAVVEGKHPDGEPLETDMPRWRMSDKDLNDLLEYLKTLP
jgi:hypothetical protein